MYALVTPKARSRPLAKRIKYRIAQQTESMAAAAKVLRATEMIRVGIFGAGVVGGGKSGT